MQFSVNIKTDEEGYTGRECPKCEKYFKIRFGTGLPDATDCHCPYCNHIGSQDDFWTKQQIEYAHSVALNKISGDLIKNLKRMEIKPKRNQLISISTKVKGRPIPIAYYSENELEEKILCDNCTLEYTIYGTFGFCPDCGIHNSKQIVDINFELVLKILDLAARTEKDIKSKLIENALEDCISAFDGYAREHCAALDKKISFQNIASARSKILSDRSIDISEDLDADQWNFTVIQFQKRHLLAHKIGVIDEEYIEKTGEDPSLIGRKVSITDEDVRILITNLKVIARNLFHGIKRS